ncbi:unnamed protein product [Orchesella dallaii]|uniref:Large ribosomal subunit protein uL30m n=1 Tax=Orchesella dallaii TaxID=48710 RepID=A0ABP1S9A5_9HEXA
MHPGSVVSLPKHALRIRSVCGSSSVGCLSSGIVALPGLMRDALTNHPSFQPSQSFHLGGVHFKFSKKMANIKESMRDPEAVKYPGFVYFPRPGEKDPPIVPAKLFMVRRIRSLYGCPWWEKQFIHDLSLERRKSIAIIKNTPSNNVLLYKLKHLIEITPITTPQGMPDDVENAFLKQNGEFVGYNLLSHHNVKVDDATNAEIKRRKKYLDGETIKGHLHKQWYTRYDVI